MDLMELKSNHNASVLTDSAPMNNSRLGLHSALLPYSPPNAVFSSSLFLTIPRKKPGLLDDVRSTCWLDAMKSKSPTHKKITKDFSIEPTDIVYLKWMLKYPFALASFEKITSYAKGKRVALFLAFMFNHMRSAVKNVAKYFPTAIISGRSRDKVLARYMSL